MSAGTKPTRRRLKLWSTPVQASESIYVLPYPNSDFVWADIGFQALSSAAITFFTAGTAAPAAGALVAGSLKTASTVKQVLEIAKTFSTLGGIYSNTKKWGTLVNNRMRQESIEVLDESRAYLEKNASEVAPFSVAKVNEMERAWTFWQYFSPSGFLSLFNASNMSLFIANESLKQPVSKPPDVAAGQ